LSFELECLVLNQTSLISSNIKNNSFSCVLTTSLISLHTLIAAEHPHISYFDSYEMVLDKV